MDQNANAPESSVPQDTAPAEKKVEQPALLILPRQTITAIPQSDWKFIAEGGEATIYRVGKKNAVKAYHHWQDPLYEDDAQQKKATKERFLEMQKKLLVMPVMPPEVVVPTVLLQTPKGSIFGYQMDFIENSIQLDSLWNTANREEKMLALRALLVLMTKLHAMDIIIGDFVPRNLLWNRRSSQLYLVDAVAMQFGGFLCKTFSLGFVDPRVLTFKKKGNVRLATLAKPFSKETDWFAYWAICFFVLCGLDPYGGTYNKLMTMEDRVKNRVSILKKGVVYPRTAKSLKIFGRKLLEIMLRVFQYGEQIEPTLELFDSKFSSHKQEVAHAK